MSFWAFSEIDIVSEYKFDKNLEKFYASGITGLVRENLQNSIDHPAFLDKPVIVKITTGKISKYDIPGFEELKKHIASLQPKNDYDKKSVTFMNSIINGDHNINYIMFEDENTTGLEGAESNDRNVETSFYAYAYEKGASYETEDSDIVRGGSHGIGKIASNSASIINTMIFSNCDEQGNQHIGGTIQLFDHFLDGNGYRGTGYLSKFDNKELSPFRNNEVFNQIFKKTTRGLKIVIPFVPNEYLEIDEIKRSAIDSFLLAINKGKLVVQINGEEINSINLEEYIYNGLFELFPDNRKSLFAASYFRTMNIKPESTNFIIEDKRGHRYSFTLYFRENEKINYAKIGIFRTIGMKIEDFQVNSHSSGPFNGVLIPNNPETDSWLKSLENEAHSEITYEHIRDGSEKDNARRFINNMHKKFAELMQEKLDKEMENISDFDTSDVLYEFDREFKRQISRMMKPILANSDRNQQKTTQTKSATKKSKEESDAQKRELTSSSRKKKKIPGINDSSRDFYYLNSSEVKRISNDDEDLIHINLGNIQFHNTTATNIVFTLIDGEGSEKISEVQLKENFSKIINSATGDELQFNDHQISNVPITGGTARIRLVHKEREVNTNKYFIYVEA